MLPMSFGKGVDHVSKLAWQRGVIRIRLCEIRNLDEFECPLAKLLVEELSQCCVLCCISGGPPDTISQLEQLLGRDAAHKTGDASHENK